MYKIGVVGDGDSILSFKSVGLDVFPCDNPEIARKTIDKLAYKNYGVIFVTENLAIDIKDTIDRYDRKLFPAVILIPSSQGSLGIGLKKISDNVEKAVGVNIL